MEQADNDFLDVGEEGYDDDFLMDAIPMEVDRPGEDEWDPEEEGRKKVRGGGSSKASTSKSKSKRAKSNKLSEFKSYVPQNPFQQQKQIRGSSKNPLRKIFQSWAKILQIYLILKSPNPPLPNEMK